MHWIEHAALVRRVFGCSVFGHVPILCCGLVRSSSSPAELKLTIVADHALHVSSAEHFHCLVVLASVAATMSRAALFTASAMALVAGVFGHARLLNPVPWNKGFSKTAPCGGGAKLPPSATWVFGEPVEIKWDLIAGDGAGASAAVHRLVSRLYSSKRMCVALHQKMVTMG